MIDPETLISYRQFSMAKAIEISPYADEAFDIADQILFWLLTGERLVPIPEDEAEDEAAPAGARFNPPWNVSPNVFMPWLPQGDD